MNSPDTLPANSEPRFKVEYECCADVTTTRVSDDLLTAKEIAAELRCSKSHAHKLINGTVPGLTPIPHLALGRKKIVPRRQLELWKRQNTTGRIPSNSEMDTVDAMHEEVHIA